MNVVKPIVGQWYRGGTNELFEVVAIDDEDETIEIQYFDGTVTEIEFDRGMNSCSMSSSTSRMLPKIGRAPIDVEAEDLDREFEDNARTVLVESPGSLAAPLSDAGRRQRTRGRRSAMCCRPRAPIRRFARLQARSRARAKSAAVASPGTAVRKVTMKKFAQPIDGDQRSRD